jgi:hypothetical protein
LILCRDRRRDDGRLECRVSRSPTGPGPAPVTAVNFPCLAPHLSRPPSYWVIIILYTVFLWCRFFVMRCCCCWDLCLNVFIWSWNDRRGRLGQSEEVVSTVVPIVHHKTFFDFFFFSFLELGEA